jgi:hypothetical protein
MPRPPKDYSQPQPYTPAPPPVPTSTPQEIIRATWAEFDKIAAYLADPANSTALLLQGSANDADQPD